MFANLDLGTWSQHHVVLFGVGAAMSVVSLVMLVFYLGKARR
ncbi:hypothetical protein [Fodinicola feengrottensis]|nr:hypothetical protein [Fodinicola feengrottensis]